MISIIKYTIAVLIVSIIIVIKASKGPITLETMNLNLSLIAGVIMYGILLILISLNDKK